MGIRSKLLVCLLVALVPIAAASLFTVHVIDERLTTRIEAELGNSRRLEAARISEVLEDYRRDAMTLAAGTHVRDFVADIDAHRRGALAADDEIGGVDDFPPIDRDADWPLQQLALALQRKAGIVGTESVELRIVGRDGRTLGESIGFGWQPRDGELVERAMTRAVPLFGDAWRNENGHRRLGLVAPVYSDRGSVVGALLLETRLGPVVDLVTQHEGLGRSSEAHVAQRLPNGDAGFITLLRFDRDAAFERVAPAESGAPIVRSLATPGGAVLRARDYRGTESILAIETIPATGWGLVVKIDAEEAFAPLAEVIGVIRVAALLTGLVVVAGWAFVLHPLARRLRRTAAAAQRITDGNLSSRIGDAAEDEIGEVARSIDRLAAELSADKRMRGAVEERLRHQAQHDELTGLYNRKRANELIAELGETPERPVALAFLDLDGFKGVNDLYGHAAGDAVLVAIAGRLQRAIDKASTLARWGGGRVRRHRPRRRPARRRRGRRSHPAPVRRAGGHRLRHPPARLQHRALDRVGHPPARRGDHRRGRSDVRAEARATTEPEHRDGGDEERREGAPRGPHRDLVPADRDRGRARGDPSAERRGARAHAHPERRDRRPRRFPRRGQEARPRARARPARHDPFARGARPAGVGPGSSTRTSASRST